MPRRPRATRRWLTAATWPIGVALTAWDYMWRTTPMRRREVVTATLPDDLQATLRSVSREDLQPQDSGTGPLFHRRYATCIREADLSAREVMAAVKANPNKAAPTTFARFQQVHGEKRAMSVGDEYVVRMPGPWDGPVRVIESTPCSFRLATLAGHLEAGQIEFRARDEGERRIAFEIESWARSSSAFANLLYHRLRMSKEVQAHMWISFLEGVVDLAGGRMTGGVEIETRRVEDR
jgi:hypothetical protein